ncbi:MAG: outer membrane lipoprotein-sorting protein [Planctomycetes bacterium]|nr:outer membrane lipoprotein-sorting protein [Planctomycetota bacterium]
MTRTLKIIVWTVAVLAVAIAPVMAQDEKAAEPKKELTVDEIVKKANHAAYYQGKDGRSLVKMTIKDPGGTTREREFTVLRKTIEDGGDQKFFVYFHQPSDVRKMTYLVWKHVGDKDDDRWLYMPALDLVKRIAASDKRTSFVGSNFLYEDISGRGTDEDTHTLTETTDKHYVLKNVPKDPKAVEFASYTLWIDKTTFLPAKAEYVNDQGKVYRTVEALEIKTIDGFPTVVKSVAKDVASGGETVSEFSEIRYNIDLKDDVFEERSLRRPPREARK